MTYTRYRAPPSMYTGKARSFLRQDGADIIDHFEKGSGQALRAFDVYPDDPTLLAISHVFEVFGGEGLLRPAMRRTSTSTPVMTAHSSIPRISPRRC